MLFYLFTLIVTLLNLKNVYKSKVLTAIFDDFANNLKSIIYK